MSKRKIRVSLKTVVIAVIAIFAFAEITAAQADCPLTTRSCSTNGWTIELLENYPKMTTNCPEGYYEYRYQVCKQGTSGDNCNAAGLARVNLAIPDCCPDEIVLTKASGCGEPLLTFPVGVGDPITKFERGDQFVYAVRLPFWGPRVNERSFCANTASLDETSICLDRRLRPSLDCCKIKGPACPTNNDPLAEVSIKQGPVEFSIQYSGGKSVDVLCPDCTEIKTLTLNDLVLYVEGKEVGTVTWLPYDTPIQSTASPECTYTRLRNGTVKVTCR